MTKRALLLCEKQLMIQSSKWMLKGKVAILKDGNAVWYGNIDDPWDDVECDTAIVCQDDFEEIKKRFQA